MTAETAEAGMIATSEAGETVEVGRPETSEVGMTVEAGMTVESSEVVEAGKTAVEVGETERTGCF